MAECNVPDPHCRIGKVVYKDGRASLHVLPKPEHSDSYDHVMAWVKVCLEGQTTRNAPESRDISGFAFMVWAKDGTSTCESQNLDGHIPSVFIPDFVRNRLLAERIEQWTLQAIK